MDDLQVVFDDEGHEDGFTKLRDENMEQEIGEVLAKSSETLKKA